MIVCDTSVWIEYFRGHTPYVDQVQSLRNEGGILGLECIFGELLQGITSKRERKLIFECWNSIAQYHNDGLWLEAGEFSAIHRLASRGIGLIDSAIAVATLRSNSRLWTLDKELASLLPRNHVYVLNLGGGL